MNFDHTRFIFLAAQHSRNEKLRLALAMWRILRNCVIFALPPPWAWDVATRTLPPNVQINGAAATRVTINNIKHWVVLRATRPFSSSLSSSSAPLRQQFTISVLRKSTIEFGVLPALDAAAEKLMIAHGDLHEVGGASLSSNGIAECRREAWHGTIPPSGSKPPVALTRHHLYTLEVDRSSGGDHPRLRFIRDGKDLLCELPLTSMSCDAELWPALAIIQGDVEIVAVPPPPRFTATRASSAAAAAASSSSSFS